MNFTLKESIRLIEQNLERATNAHAELFNQQASITAQIERAKKEAEDLTEKITRAEGEIAGYRATIAQLKRIDESPEPSQGQVGSEKGGDAPAQPELPKSGGEDREHRGGEAAEQAPQEEGA